MSEIQKVSYNKLLLKIEEAINYKLKEGFEYIYNFHIWLDDSGKGIVDSSFYGYRNGIIDKNEMIYYPGAAVDLPLIMITCIYFSLWEIL